MATSIAGVRVGEISWQEVDKRLQAGATALLPIGAAAKSHGAHLPMNTDFVQAEWLAEQLMREGNVLVWPTVGYGYYPAFLEYPGSCSIPSQTFQEVIRNILEDIMRAGASHILVINTGISTIKPVEEAAEIFPMDKRPVIAHVYRGKRFLGVAAKIQQQAFGGHADELETSIMLAVAPQSVDLSQAQPWDSKELQPGPLHRADPTHPNYSPQGVYGDPTLATAEKGKLLVQAILDDLREFLRT
jgi:creatinine amidohydrolase